MVIWGGAGSSFIVNASSPQRGAAVAFLQWLTEDPQQAFLARTTINLPATRLSVAELPETLQAFGDDMDHVIHPSLLPAAEFPAVIEAFGKGIQSILIGEKTAEQVAAEVQAIKERELARAVAVTR